jgi:hypothetical protein
VRGGVIACGGPRSLPVVVAQVWFLRAISA